MIDITLCEPVIVKKYPELKDVFINLCQKIKENGNKQIGTPSDLEAEFTEEERYVFRLLSMEMVKIQLSEVFDEILYQPKK